MSGPSRIDHFEVVKTIHKGKTTTVKLAKDLEQNNRYVALKISRASNPTFIQSFRSSFEALRSHLPHPHVVEIYSFSSESLYHSKNGTSWPVMYYSMELCAGGSLYDYLALSGGMIESHLRTIAGEILSALECLHTVGHGGLCPDRLLLSADFTVKLTHFTLRSGPMADRNEAYFPPEWFTTQSCNSEASDIFALGVILYNLLLFIPPFSAADPKSDQYQVFLSNKSLFWQQKRGKFMPPSPYFIQMIDAMLASDPAHRPTLQQVVNHQWLCSVIHRENGDVKAFMTGGFTDMQESLNRKRNDSRRKRAIQNAGSHFKGEVLEHESADLHLRVYTPYRHDFFRLFLLFTTDQTLYILRNTMRDRSGYSLSEEVWNGSLEVVHRSDDGRETKVKLTLLIHEDILVLEVRRISGCFFSFLSVFYLLKTELDYTESLFSL